jgi:site-specific recombinase XerD
VPETAIVRAELAGHPLARTTVGPPTRHPAATYLARLAPSSRRVQRSALDAIATILTDGRCDALTLDWAALRYEHTTAVRAVLLSQPSQVTKQPYAPTTANRHLTALRGVLKECWRLGFVGVEDFHRAADLEPIRGSRLPRGRALDSGEVKALFDGCADDAHGAIGTRDAAILAVLYGAGLRRAEVVGLDLRDYDRKRGTLKVRGKGNKERVTHVGAGGRAAIEDWLELRGAAAGALFWPVHRSGRVGPARRLTAQAIWYLAESRGKDAQIDAFSPHDLRRSFVSDLLDAGVDLSTVQQMAGHAQVQTTARYDRRGDEAKAEAAKQLHVPYRRRRRGLVA